MKIRLAPVSFALLLAVAAVSPRLWPQNTVRKQPLSSATRVGTSRGNFKVDSPLVLLNVAVTDPRGRFVMGLQRQDFEVFEEKTAQTVIYFSTEEAPVSVGLVLDFSRSMAAKFNQLQQAVAEFLKSANPADEFCLIEFRDRAELSVGFTGVPEEIQNRVAATRPAGNTALLDAVHLGLHQMKRARTSRKILLIVSDGGDNHSRYNAREVENVARESDVEIYAIGIGTARAGTIYDPWEGPSLMNELTESAGGRYYQIDSARDLPAVAEKIGRELRHQYVLGYVPGNRRPDGRYRHVQVKVARPPGHPRLSAYWKHGYYAPAE